MLLLLNTGIFFEFIPADEYFDENPTRLHIGEVELNKNYALIINSNAGLWGYSIGDTVKFVSLNPHRVVVSGRIKHFISAFGEHVIGEEVEKAMKHACALHPEVELVEFTVAPMVAPTEGLPIMNGWLNLPNRRITLINFSEIWTKNGGTQCILSGFNRWKHIATIGYKTTENQFLYRVYAIDRQTGWTKQSASLSQ